MSVTLGQIVVSKAGRDAGKRFIVVGIIDELYVLVADGDLRRMEKPKKKKVKHLAPTADIAGILEEKLKNNTRVTNAELRKTLAYLNKETFENNE